MLCRVYPSLSQCNAAAPCRISCDTGKCVQGNICQDEHRVLAHTVSHSTIVSAMTPCMHANLLNQVGCKLLIAETVGMHDLLSIEHVWNSRREATVVPSLNSTQCSTSLSMRAYSTRPSSARCTRARCASARSSSKPSLVCQAVAAAPVAPLQTNQPQPTIQQQLSPAWLSGKNVLIFGWAESGVSAAKLAAEHGGSVLGESLSLFPQLSYFL